MWYEGHLQTWEDVSEETVLFFLENEHLTTPLKGCEPQLSAEDDINYISDNTHMPWCPVDIDVPWKDIYAEANHLLYTSCYTLHRPNSSGWLSLCIYGMSSVHTNVPEDYGLPDEAEYELSDWTDIAKFCPRTREWMQDTMLYERFSRVRFMAVLPDGWLGPHRDKDKMGFGATNVAINNPEGCALVHKGWGTMPFTPGSVFKINTGYEHAVWNRSEEPRIHMIFDGDPSDEFKRRVNASYARMQSI